jgi:octanoyl-[GcvH]:protein N-octanoyltransferase
VPGLDVHAIEDAVVRTYAEYATMGQADFSSLRA